MERKIVYVSKIEYKVREVLAQITYIIIIALITLVMAAILISPMILMYLANITRY